MRRISQLRTACFSGAHWLVVIALFISFTSCDDEGANTENAAAIKFAIAPCLGPAPGGEVESGVSNASTCRSDLDRLTQRSNGEPNGCLVLNDKTSGTLHRRSLRYTDGLLNFISDAPMVIDPGNDAEASIFLFGAALPPDGCTTLVPDSQCASDSECLMRLGPSERTISGKRETVFDFIQDGEYCIITRGQLPPGALQELCDGADNDCDGVADESFETLGEACVSGEGPCARQGIFVCLEDGTMGCDGQPAPPSEEICDLIDNDCDGLTDEMLRCEGCRTENDCIGNPGGPFCIDGGCHTCQPVTSQGCEGSAPICDPLALRCRGCAGPEECPQGLCLADGRCGRCDPSDTSTCTPTSPVCDPVTLDCRGCSGNEECPGVCVFEQCAECNPLGGVESGCPAEAPVCSGTDFTCRRCETESDCALFVGPGTFCVDGACATCDPRTQEGCSDPDAPVCDETSRSCRACSGGAECSTGRCLEGRCVGCDPVDSRGCASVSARICDAEDVVCRGCLSTAECDMVVPGTFCLNDGQSQQGRCVECDVTEGGRCVISSANPVCRDYECQPCETDVECRRRAGNEGVRLFCVNGTCEECRGGDNPGGCSPPLSVCDDTTGSCRGCVDDSECDGATPFCARGGDDQGVCRQCDPDRPSEACGGVQPICDEASGECRGCVPRDCAENGDFCLSGRCVGCEPGTNVGCDLSSAAPFCNPDGICRECDRDAECPEGALCSDGRCTGCRASTGTELLGLRVDEGCTITSPICGGTSCRECQDGECGDGFCIDGACRPCRPSDHAGCPGPDPTAPFCDAADFACVGCLASTPEFCATNQRPVCDSLTRTCVGCTDDQECASIDADRPLCSSGRCGECRITDQGVSEGCEGAQPYCDDSLTCDGCQLDSHCPAGTVCNFPTDGRCGDCTQERQDTLCPTAQPICSDALECVGCDLDADCSPRFCNVATERCVECRLDSHCASGVCNGDGDCVECQANADCPADTPICHSNQTCGACSSTAQCAEIADHLVCSVSGVSGTCEVCDPNSNEGCDAGTYCNQLYQCVECRDATHCDGATPVCTRDFVCRECQLDSDCRSADERLCSANSTCVQCLRDFDCPQGLSCGADNRCTNCESDNDCLDSTPICSAAGICRECQDTTECLGDLICSGTPGQRKCAQCDFVTQTGCDPGLLCNTDFECVGCVSDGNCRNGQVCTAENTCVDCESDEDCQGQGRCSPDQTCVACLSDEDCPGIDVCGPVGQCVECNGNEDCPSALVCKNNSCTNCAPDVGSDSECSAGLVCSATDDFRCRECDPAEQRGCSPEAVCNGNFRCSECALDSDCPSEQRCIGFECLRCLEDEDCNNGQRCNAGNECVDCLEDSDCLTGACNDDGTCAGCTNPLGCLLETEVIEQKVVAPNSTGQEMFGYSVALSGSRALVSAHKASLLVGGTSVTSGAVDFFEKNEQGTWIHKQRFYPSAPSSDLNFGIHVAMEGRRAVIGTFAGTTSERSAYVFELNENGLWVEVARLEPSETSSNSRFGRYVSLKNAPDGTATVVVGAPYERVGQLNKGAIHQFILGANGEWQTQGRLLFPGASGGAEFGSSFSWGPDGLLVGAPAQSLDGNLRSGSAHLYQGQVSANWGTSVLLSPAPASNNLFFGKTIAWSGDAIIVGATGATNGIPNAGSGWVYTVDENGDWSLSAFLQPPVPSEDYQYGDVVVLDNGLAALSARGTDYDGNGNECGGAPGCGSFTGTVHLVQRQSETVWTELGRIRATSGHSFQMFGRAMALEGTQLLVGAYGDRANSTVTLTGAAFFYDLDSLQISNTQ